MNQQSLPTVGISPEALIGRDINMHFYSQRWLGSLKQYIDEDRIIPTRIPLCHLPESATTIKSVGTYRVGISECATIPASYSMYMTSDRRAPTFRSYLPRLQFYMELRSKSTWREDWHHSYGNRGTPLSNTPEPKDIFKDSDPEWAVFPTISFSSSPLISLDTIRDMQIGVEYILRLMQIALHVQYDEGTLRWMERMQ